MFVQVRPGFGGVLLCSRVFTRLGARRLFRRRKMAVQVKQVLVDVEAFGLTDTWETTSYQRAIGVEPLWQTFLLLLEPHSRISINRLSFAGFRITGHASECHKQECSANSQFHVLGACIASRTWPCLMSLSQSMHRSAIKHTHSLCTSACCPQSAIAHCNSESSLIDVDCVQAGLSFINMLENLS